MLADLLEAIEQMRNYNMAPSHMAVSYLFPGQGGSSGGPGPYLLPPPPSTPQKAPKTNGKASKTIPEGTLARVVS